MPQPLHIRVERKAFNERVVLSRIDLEVREREVVALIGPSGCGKSTLLRIAAGLERDYFGEVRLGDEPVLAPRRELGILFREPRLLPWLTVAQNVSFGDAPSAQTTQRAHALLEEVGLRELANAFPMELSPGMAQRVSLARALARQPQLLLSDQPFGAVDALTRDLLQELLLELVHRHGIAMLAETHDADEALMLADRVVVLPGTPGTQSTEIVNLDPPRKRSDLKPPRPHPAAMDELRNATALQSRLSRHG